MNADHLREAYTLKKPVCRRSDRAVWMEFVKHRY